MLVSKWLVLDPKGDRPYLQDFPPVTLQRTPEMRVYRVQVQVAEPVPIDGLLSAEEAHRFMELFRKGKMPG